MYYLFPSEQKLWQKFSSHHSLSWEGDSFEMDHILIWIQNWHENLCSIKEPNYFSKIQWVGIYCQISNLSAISWWDHVVHFVLDQHT